MSLRWTTTARPAICFTPLISFSCPLSQIRWHGEMPGHGSGCGHGRRHQVGTAAGTLAALKVPVAGRGRALTWREDVAVHAQAHGAAGRPPLKAGVGELLVQPFFLGLRLDQRRARNHKRPDAPMYLAASPDLAC